MMPTMCVGARQAGLLLRCTRLILNQTQILDVASGPPARVVLPDYPVRPC